MTSKENGEAAQHTCLDNGTIDHCIIHLSFNSSMNLLVFPPPKLPDICGCGDWYKYPETAELDDCLTALDKLPEGFEPDTWHLEPQGEKDWISGRHSLLALNLSTS